MNRTIYCFSGTGNTLHVANSIAVNTNSKLILVDNSLLDDESLEVPKGSVGFYFPVYHQRVPGIILRLLNHLDLSNAQYIYAVVTYGNKVTLSLSYFNKALEAKGYHLDNGFGIQMPYNYVKPSRIGYGFYSSFMLTKRKHKADLQLLHEADIVISEITADVEQKIKGDYPITDETIERIVEVLHLRDSFQKSIWLRGMHYHGEKPSTFGEAIGLMDHAFNVNERCIECGLCQRLCPVKNIHLVDQKPVFEHHCEQCFRCVAFCPTRSILPSENLNQIPYCHPMIEAEDYL